MTAAVVGVAPDPPHGRRRAPNLDNQRVNGQRATGQRATDQPPGDDPVRQFPADTRSPGVPYLATVPDCEPPFDDELDSPPRIRPVSRPMIRPTSVSAAVQSAPSAPPGTSTRGTTDARGAEAPEDRTSGGTGTGSRAANGPRPAAVRRVAGVTPGRIAALGRTGGTATAATSPLVHSSAVPAWSEEADIGVRLTTTADLPAAERSASVLARAVIEVLSGRRPLGQLRVHCAPDVYAGLADRPQFASAALPHLVSVRVRQPADGVAEVSVAYRRAERVRALAFRIQGVDGRWRMTALELC